LRALTISAHGGLEQLELRSDVAEPVVADGIVRVRVAAAALNHLDLFTLGGLPGVNIVPPWIMGADGTGVVESVGNGATGIRVGDTVVINPGLSDWTCEYCQRGEQSECVRFRLLGEHAPGTIAEYVSVPAKNVKKISAAADVNSAAAFTMATLTAWRMVKTRARVEAGDDVLIWGIGGGVAQAALRICKEIGARVWVTSGSEEKLERARQLGADELLNHRTMNVAKEIRARTGKRGVTVVIDSVGQATWESSLGALGRGGRLVTCGGTSGAIVETDVRRLFWNQWTILGSTMGNDSEFESVVNAFNEGRLAPVIDSVFGIEDGKAAFARMASGDQFGKIVVRISS
jgi:NADPH:quinone reductase-like Zn-dependent oxidoreductase